jgi:general stress protein 26
MKFKISIFVFLLITIHSEFLFSQKNPEVSRQELLNAAREIMLSSKKCALITQDEQGVPQVRTMDPFSPEADFTVWLATNPKSRKVEQIKNNSSVTLYYPDKKDKGYVVIHGTAKLVNDQKEKDTRWKTEWKNFYPNQTDQYLLIKVTPHYLELINYNHGLSGDPTTWQPVRVDFK